MTKRRFGGFGTKRSTLHQSNNKGCRLEDPFKETGPRRNHFSFDTRLPEVLFKFTHPHPKQVKGNYLVDPVLFDFQVLLHQKKGGRANRTSSMDWRIVGDGGLVTIFSAPVTSSTKWGSWKSRRRRKLTQASGEDKDPRRPTSWKILWATCSIGCGGTCHYTDRSHTSIAPRWIRRTQS